MTLITSNIKKVKGRRRRKKRKEMMYALFPGFRGFRPFVLAQWFFIWSVVRPGNQIMMFVKIYMVTWLGFPFRGTPWW